jgi:hypothetical protein
VSRPLASDRRGGSRLGCLLQLLLVVAIGYVAVNVGEEAVAYFRYRDAMKQEVKFAATRSDGEMKRRLRAFTDSVKLPLAAKNVNIVRDDRRIRIWTNYDQEVRLLNYSRTFHLRPSAEKTF